MVWRPGEPTVAGEGPSAILPAVEQRIGSIIPPVPAAGTDPAYIPGLTSPPPAEAQDAAAGETAPDEAAERPSEDVVPGEEEAEEPGTAEEEDDDGAAGPVFEASDHRGSITADRTGITFRLDGEEAEFGWDEIGAVQLDIPRFGRRFSVTVHTLARRWYEADVAAPSRNVLKEWTAELDAVLDVYFEEAGESTGEDAEP